MPIQYGLPAHEPEPGVAYGGCVVEPEMAQGQCGACGDRWGLLMWGSPDETDVANRP